LRQPCLLTDHCEAGFPVWNAKQNGSKRVANDDVPILLTVILVADHHVHPTMQVLVQTSIIGASPIIHLVPQFHEWQIGLV